jgi:hypothetical protein
MYCWAADRRWRDFARTRRLHDGKEISWAYRPSSFALTSGRVPNFNEQWSLAARVNVAPMDR